MTESEKERQKAKKARQSSRKERLRAKKGDREPGRETEKKRDPEKYNDPIPDFASFLSSRLSANISRASSSSTPVMIMISVVIMKSS